MASKAKQQNYRRLMKEAKGKSSSQQKKIDHPLARYNALDQLSCIVCQQAVKSELLWGTHLKSKRHKENIADLKINKEILQPTPSKSKGESSDAQPLPPQKKNEPSVGSGGDLDKNSEEPLVKKQKVTDDVEHKEKNDKKELTGLPVDFFDPGVSKFGGDEDSDSGDDGRGRDSMASQPTSGAPLDPKTEEKVASSNRSEGKDALPEGFFDDPKLDAKARKVEYRDKMEDEWEKFQKTIQKEKDVSEAIQFGEDEEAQGERDLTEVQEQVECFKKAEVLRLKQEELLGDRSKECSGESSTSRDKHVKKEETHLVAGGEEERTESSDDSACDLDDLEMDWRAKHS